MIKELLPIGSVVMLKNGKKRVMIYGIKQSDPEGEDKEYDYVAVLYPEGNIGVEFQYLFNHEDIEEVFFRGYADDEREEFVDKLSKVYENIDSFK